MQAGKIVPKFSKTNHTSKNWGVYNEPINNKRMLILVPRRIHDYVGESSSFAAKDTVTHTHK